MDQRRRLTVGMLARVLAGVTLVMLLVIGEGHGAIDFRNPWDRYYDPSHGSGVKHINKHFNMHRGRWWNYFARGSLFLAYGHYGKALEDFDKAIAKRGTDRRDARTYGMHFMDYFPHRESGVAYYFQGIHQTQGTAREERLEKAIRELETSLGQEKSARAQSYLNRARRAFWQVTRKRDCAAPVISLQKPIYTRQRRVRFDVTVTDEYSYVGDIRASTSAGQVWPDVSGVSVEWPRREITKTVDFRLGANEKMAAVTITATDLAGNSSGPNRALVILDNAAPTVGVSAVEPEWLASNRVVVAIDAQDDFGLRQIHVGPDPNDSVPCAGALKYSGTVTGLPTGGVLTLSLVDNAGNTMVANVPVRSNPTPARSSVPASLPMAPWLPLADHAGAPPWDQSFAPWLASDEFAGTHFIPLSPIPSVGLSVLTVAAQNLRASGPSFDLDESVRPKKDTAKETSHHQFVVKGRIWEPGKIDRVKIRLDEQEKERGWDVSKRPPKFRAFGLPPIELSDKWIGKTKHLKLEAFLKDDPNACLTEELKVTRVEDASRKEDAVYGLLVLPLSLVRESDLTAPERTDWGPSRLARIYEDLLAKLSSLPMSDRTYDSGDASHDAFRVYHVTDVYRVTDVEAWYELGKNEEDVTHDLWRWRKKGKPIGPRGIDPKLIDLVIYGDLQVRYFKPETAREETRRETDVTADEENKNEVEIEVDIRLRAVDVASEGGYLRFPRSDPPSILADIDYREGTRQQRLRMLADEVTTQIPRLRDDVVVYEADGQGGRRRLEFDFGEEAGAFTHMKLWFYEKDTPENAKLTEIDCVDLVDIGPKSSRVVYDTNQAERHKESHYTVITK